MHCKTPPSLSPVHVKSSCPASHSAVPPTAHQQPINAALNSLELDLELLLGGSAFCELPVEDDWLVLNVVDLV